MASIGSRLPEIPTMRITSATEALVAPPLNGHADLSLLAAPSVGAYSPGA